MEENKSITVDDLYKYLDEYKIKWTNISNELKSAKYISIFHYNWVYKNLITESNYINGLIDLYIFDTIIKDKFLFNKSKIDLELIQFMQTAYILANQNKINFWDKYFGKLKMLKLPKNFGEIEFEKV